MILKKRAFDQRMQSQNIAHMLENRESGYKRIKYSQCPDLAYERQFYKAITPWLTIGIIIPPVFLRKFTPDGRSLLAFSHDQRSLIVYDYKGIGPAGLGELYIKTDNVFEHLFKVRHVLRLCQGDSSRFYLHREFSVFLQDSRYVLLAGMSVRQTINMDPADFEKYPDLFDKVEPFSYIFFVVDLKKGIVTDEVRLNQDAISLSHNHGISVYGRTIAILSRLRQCIYIYELVNGRLIKREHEIGPAPANWSHEHLSSMDAVTFDVNTLLPITHIKQRVLSFLYRQIQPGNPQASESLKEFYKNFEFIENMIIEKMQLVDNDLLLLRYEERPKDNDVSILVTAERRRLYVFYGINKEKVLGVYHGDSVDLLRIVVQFYDKLCNVRSLHTGDAPSPPSAHSMMHNYFTNTGNTAPPLQQAALRYNLTVPISTQSFSTSPYLNYNLFKYDDHLVSPLERPKACPTEPVVFRDPETNLVRFRFDIQSRRPSRLLSPRELCAFIYHPFEPLVISIQKCMHVYGYNLHFYHHGTTIEKS